MYALYRYLILFAALALTLFSAKVFGFNRISDMSFSPDSKLLAWVREDGSVHLMDTATGKQVFNKILKRGPLRSVAFSPDGKWLVATADGSRADNKSLMVWQVT